MTDAADFTVQPYGAAEPIRVTVSNRVEGNLYIDIDGDEYGSLFFERGGQSRFTVTLGQPDFTEQQWVERNPVGSVLGTRPRPDLPDVGSRVPGFGTVIDALWSTSDPEWDGAFTAHLLTMRDEGDGRYAVSLVIWDDDDHTWSLLDSDDYPSIGLAARQWARITGDDTP